MAKKSMIAREVKREKLVKQYAERRAALKAIVSNQREACRRALQSNFGTRKVAAELCCCTSAQSLSTHRASTRLLP